MTSFGNTVPSAPHTPRCLGFSLQFSSCGRLLYTIALIAPANMADTYGRGVPAAIVYASYAFNPDINFIATSPVSGKVSSSFSIRLDSISDSLFSATWTHEYAYVTVVQCRMKIFRFELAQLSSPQMQKSDVKNVEDTGSTNNGSYIKHRGVSVLEDAITLPENALSRTARFFLGDGGSGVVIVGARRPPKIALPISVYLDEQSLGRWVGLHQRQRPILQNEYPCVQESQFRSKEKELVFRGSRIRLLPAPGSQHQTACRYKSLDGVLTVWPGATVHDFSFSITPGGDRHPTTTSGIPVVDSKDAKNDRNWLVGTRLTRYKEADPWVAFTNAANEDELFSGGETSETSKENLPKFDPAEVLSTVYARTYAPPSSMEKGAYWRSNTASDTSHAAMIPSELCCRCRPLGLTRTDFLDDDCEEEGSDSRDQPIVASGNFYSFQCDVCSVKFKAPCVSYRCKTCRNGQHDICTACYQKDRSFHDAHHQLRRSLFEIGYHDRPIAKVENDSFDTAANWDGRLGTLEEVKSRKACPLCRLAVRSLEETRQQPRARNGPIRYDNKTGFGYIDANDDDDSNDDQVVLSWHGFGWNRGRWHLQGRYLIAEHGKTRGQPIVLLSECHPFSPFTAHRLTVSTPLPISRFKKWLRQCEEYHGWNCHGDSSRLSGSDLANFRVIDVLDRCIVKVSFHSRFVALSYVWGHARQFRASKSNIHLLESKGYLGSIEAQLPRTITDAMSFTRQMGQRYLWVDALCIVQDDPESVTSLVDKMDLIYGISTFTIIAAAGDSSASGLPGVRPGSRTPRQHVEQLAPDVKLAVLFDLESRREQTVHETRAWTFQEMLLSRRRFIFLDEIVYFQCERRMCREDFCARRPDVITSVLQRSGASTSATAYFGQRSGRWYGPGETWERLVQAYQRRSLSVPSDILRGFQGLQTQLGEQKRLHFFMGMPIEHLDSSLLWAPRRQATRRPGFPSFSWAGWTGQAILSSTPSEHSHPFIPAALADNKRWYTEDTYIEWHDGKQGGGTALLRSSGKLAYSWLTGPDKSVKTDKSKSVSSTEVDSMGRPLTSNHTQTGYSHMPSSQQPNPRSLSPKPTQLPRPAAPNQDCLAFAALVADNLVLDESRDLGIAGLPDPGIVRLVYLKCQEHGKVYGQGLVTDQLEQELGTQLPSRITVLLLSNSMLKMNLALLGTEKDGCQRGNHETGNGVGAFHYVLLVKRHGDGVVERVGIGLLGEQIYACGSDHGNGLTWEWVYLI